MQSLVIFGLLCGLSTLVVAQIADKDFIVEELTMFVDPFLMSKCAKKGVNFDAAQAEAKTCIQRNAAGSIGTGSSVGAGIGAVCNMQDSTRTCSRTFIDTLKGCYDDASKKKELEKALESQKAIMDYICEDDGRRQKDLMSDSGSLECMAKMEDQSKLKGMMTCIQEQMEKFQKLTNEALADETMCKVAIKLSNCMLKMFSDCDSSKPWDFFHGMLEAGLRASPCEPYVDEYLGSAGSLSVHLGLLALLAMLYVYVI